MNLLTPSLDIVSPGEKIEKMLGSKYVKGRNDHDFK